MKVKKRLYSIEDVTLPTQVVALIFDEASREGVTAQALLEGTGLSQKDLQNQSTKLRYEQLLKLSANALQHYPKPGLGLIIGSQERISTWGLLGFAMMSQKTLEDALKVANCYYYTSPALVDLEVHTNSNDCYVRAYTPFPIGDCLQMVIEELATCVQSVFSIMLGQPFRFTRIEVAFDRPSYSELYNQYFGCPIEYNCPATHLYFSPELLPVELVNSDSVSAQLSVELCQKAIVQQHLERDLVSDIRRILTRHPGRFPSMERVADELHISPRSLRRSLADRDCSFQGLLDDVRKNMAIDYLQSTTIALDNIACLVGFTEYNNFRKAFKRWTGHPPSFYRPQ